MQNYLNLHAALLAWETQISADVTFDRLWLEFQEISILFETKILPEESPQLLSIQVEMHRLAKLIESDLTILKTTRSVENKLKRQQQIIARSTMWRSLCDRVPTG